MKPIVPVCFADPAFVSREAECALLQGLIRPHFAHCHERLIIFGFDERNRLIGLTENEGCHARHATLSSQMVREMLGFGPHANCLVVHNHPSGEAGPSPIDIAVTNRLVMVAEMIGQAVRDHIILTGAGHFSFRAAGLL